jgi:pectinesterase
MKFHLLCLCFLLPAFAIGQDYPVYLTVAQDGSGDFTTIQAAIDNAKAFPDQRITIYIKRGIYTEKVNAYSWNTNLTLKGEDSASTVIRWNDHFNKINKGRNSTFHTATLLVQGQHFQGENLTIENTAGPVGQAIALSVEADDCHFKNCRIKGYQDALYVAGAGFRQYFRGCYVEGTTDFIFGAAAAIFDSCEIRSKSNSWITAASTPSDQRVGLVFRHCSLTADAGVTAVFLGRPWRDYAKTVFLYCHLGPHIRPEGWQNWEGTQRDKTAFYAEYNNTGAGSTPTQRVGWSKQLSRKQAKYWMHYRG